MGMEIERGILPPDIITEILCRLPADSAMRCKRICKQWRSLIDHPSFVDTHTHQLTSAFNVEKLGNCLIHNSSCSGLFICAQQMSGSSNFRLQLIEYYDDEERLVPDFKLSKPITDHPFAFSHQYCGALMISSCNGLVFMGATKPNNDMFVCNPFTREYVNLGTSNTIEYLRRCWRGRGRMTYGFGYLPCTNECKVVSILYDDDFSKAKGQVSVYTLGSGIGWRFKGEIPYQLFRFHRGLFANGAIHWYMYGDDCDRKIVSFDLADEEFRVVLPLPPSAPSPHYIDKLGVLGGCLCVTRTNETRSIPRDVWILNFNKKKEELLWKRKFSIPWRNNVFTSMAEPCAILKSGKLLLCSSMGIPSYNLKTEAFYEDGTIFPDSMELYKIIPYTPSFVSLKELEEEDANFFGVTANWSQSQSQQ